MNLLLKLILSISLCFLSIKGHTKSLIDKAQDGHPNSQFELAFEGAYVDTGPISDWLLIAALQDHQKAINYLIKFSNDKILIINELRLINQKNTEFLQAYSSIAKIKKKDLID